MFEKEFNPSQLSALDLNRHVAITAAAGSGKTTVLVERFVRTLEENGFRPEHIVAITFTEEAAAQMRERIRKAVEKRRDRFDDGEEEGGNPWNRALRFLSAARITTIHGFCLSLLREHPLEAGLNPGFRLLPPGEQELGLSEFVKQSLSNFSASRHPALATLLRYVGRAGLAPTLREMIRRRNHLPTLASGELQTAELEKIYRRETASVILRLPEWDRLGQILDAVPARLLRDGSSCSRRSEAQLRLRRRLDDLEEADFIRLFDETLGIRISPSRDWKESGLYQPLKEAWDGLKKQLRRHPLEMEDAASEKDLHFRSAVDALACLYREILDGFQKAKRRQSAVDFEDLLSLARRLVRNAEVRESVRRRCRWFLVDEFQDTNRLQWEILQPLIGDKGSFFAVGDAKQSIYRFRDADVAVFREVQDWVEKRGRLVDMPQNYRSLPDLVDFNNRVFSKLFAASLPFEASHQQMEACRPIVEGGRGSVEVLLRDAGSANSQPDSEAAAAWIAKHLEEGRRHAGEIAILLRTRTRLKEYERTLQEAGIPFQTVGGIGFYERQEVVDLINVLNFLANPRHDAALLGALRSPVLNISDEDLYLISRGEGSTLWEKLKAGAGPGAAENRRFAASSLRRWLENRQTETLGELLTGIVRDTGYLETLSASRRSVQNLANVDKFIQTARQFESAQRRDLREFLRFLEALVESEAAEAEGAVRGPALDCVRIYTIHGAKGLQFPVVVLPELGAPLSAAPRDRYLCETLSCNSRERTFVGFKIRNPSDAYEELSHPVFRMLNRLDEYRQTAEEKRLLYVACTRAEDRLVLIGEKTKAPSYAAWLAEAGAESFQARPDPEVQSPNSPSAPGLRRTGEVRSFQAIERQRREVPDSRFEVRVRQEVVPEKTVWTPTEIAAWSQCARKFYLAAVEGRSDDHDLVPQPLGGVAVLTGSAVHAILETTPDLQRREAVEGQIRIWEERLSALLPENRREAIRRSLEGHVRSLAESGFHQRMKCARRMFREKKFNIRWKDLWITGVLDRLFQEADGRWVVVDFKTNQIRTDQVEAKVAEMAYDLQVEIYLWAVSRILSTDRLEGALFFTRTGDLRPIPFDARVADKCERILAQLPRRQSSEEFKKTTAAARCQSCGFYRLEACGGAVPSQGSLW